MLHVVEKLTKTAYDRLRRAGMDEAAAVRAARVEAAFKYLDGDVVKLEVVPDDEFNYEGSDSEEDRKEIRDRVAHDGVWGIRSYWRNHPGEDEDWEEVESIWGFVGDDWKGSGYDTDIMLQALQTYVRNAEDPDGELVAVARYGMGEKGIPQLSPAPTEAPRKALPYRFSRHTLRVRQNMYEGWDVLWFEQTPEGSSEIKKTRSRVSSKSEALKLARLDADALAKEIKKSPNVIRVLDEYSVCVYAVRTADGVAMEVPCPMPIIANPRKRRSSVRRRKR